MALLLDRVKGEPQSRFNWFQYWIILHVSSVLFFNFEAALEEGRVHFHNQKACISETREERAKKECSFSESWFCKIQEPPTFVAAGDRSSFPDEGALYWPDLQIWPHRYNFYR